MIEISDDTEALINAKARSAGRTPDEIVRTALSRIGAALPWRSPARPRPRIETKADLVAAMEVIAARSAARPEVDVRSADEILGYDDFGLPR